ncbi:hypothetical protein SAMN05660350_03393 [Geodermatophilus obscurus]|uniref:Uncharacterized protein n=1 Tax=Geodermatophilus obscurus TaxID=1861 RepID=A0A1M7UJZ2_9ACTN|nr:hypothetical protein [Geodermatophilus obscurus]SHN83197.1 hypothetical protein SAMN05660350_03393 [Geodermatophilus obscurus]
MTVRERRARAERPESLHPAGELPRNPTGEVRRPGPPEALGR